VSGNAKVTSANTDTEKGTIYLKNNMNHNARLVMSGGTVENTSTTTGNAIRNDSPGIVQIASGTVSKAGNNSGYALYNGGGTIYIKQGGPTITGRTYGISVY